MRKKKHAAEVLRFVEALRAALDPFAAKIRWAFIYGSIARGEEYEGSDVDLMIVGDVAMRDLSRTLRHVETELDRDVNPTIYTPEDFSTKLHGGHHFVTAVMRHDKIMVIGNQDELEKA